MVVEPYYVFLKVTKSKLPLDAKEEGKKISFWFSLCLIWLLRYSERQSRCFVNLFRKKERSYI